MALPFDWAGEVRFPDLGAELVDNATLRAALTTELTRHSPSNVEETSGTVTFTAGPLRLASGLNVLTPVDRGTIRIDQSTVDLVVRYELSVRHVFWISTAVLGTISVLDLLLLHTSAMPQTIIPYVLGWSWLVGINVALARWRFRLLIRHALAAPLSRAQRTQWATTKG